MKPPLWSPKEPEVFVPYDDRERKKYAHNLPSIYFNVRWNPIPLKASPPPGECYWAEAIGGRSKHGEFPVVVVREHYRKMGYTVWASEPRLVNPLTDEPEGYVAVSFPGARDPRHRHHAAYRRMLDIFGSALVRLNEIADRAKVEFKGNRSGGDPDLFVFRIRNISDRFFVEVKDRDNLTPTQLTCFPLIEEHLCAVKVARIVTCSAALHVPMASR